MPAFGCRELAREELVLMISFKMILKYCFKYTFSNQIFVWSGSSEKYLLGPRNVLHGPTMAVLSLKQVFHLSHASPQDPKRHKLTD